MTDFIEKSVENYELLLNYQIKQAQKQLGEKRKQALPSAVRCVGCQWQFERTHERGYR